MDADYITFTSQLDTLLPRYLRKQLQSDDFEFNTEKLSHLKPVQWLKGFYAIPGCESVSSIKVDEKDYKELGLYPVDAASVLPIMALGLSNASSCKVLDLCCCPGSKFQMIAERISQDSLIVGVDLSGKRLEVCRSLLRSWLMKLASLSTLPRQLLFEADGTQFGSNQLGNLIFDSSIFLKEFELNKDRKKMNKSARIRENKQLAESQNELTAKQTTAQYLQLFDYVLVDAECTHDASYRHVKFFENNQQGKWSGINEKKRKLSDGTTSPDNTVQPQNVETTETTCTEGGEELPSNTMKLSHSIRDWKVSCEGKVQLQQTQRQLLWNGYSVLNPGGILVYSTCSQDEAQNEDIIRWFLQEVPGAYLEDPFGQLSSEEMIVEYVTSSSPQEPLTQLQQYFHDSTEDIHARSRYICDLLCAQSKVYVQHGTLPLTIRVNYEVGMSGHFIARLRKPM